MGWLSDRLRRRAAPVRTAIEDRTWSSVVERQAFLHRLDASQRERLRALSDALLASKAINAAAGLTMNDEVVASIASQAALPVLELGIGAYPRFEEIVVYPSDFVVERASEDENGVVHEWTEAIAGESWDGGPVVLAWDAASGARGGKAGGPDLHAFNVVIHEFTHKLDMTNGAVDGVPAFHRQQHAGLDPQAWSATLHAALDDFAERLDVVERAIPRHIDPDSLRADRYYGRLPLDAYAATDEAEFFSVSSEAFFVTPERLREAYPQWYALLSRYFLQDPLR